MSLAMKSTRGEILVAVLISGVLAVLAAIGGFVAGIFLCRLFFSGESSESALILAPATALLVGAAAFVFAFRKMSSYGERPDGLP